MHTIGWSESGVCHDVLGWGGAGTQAFLAVRQKKKVVEIANRNTSVISDPILLVKLKSPISSIHHSSQRIISHKKNGLNMVKSAVPTYISLYLFYKAVWSLPLNAITF